MFRPLGREQIRYAATARYPAEPAQTSDRIQMAAIDDVENNKVTLMNLSDNSIPPSTVRAPSASPECTWAMILRHPIGTANGA